MTVPLPQTVCGEQRADVLAAVRYCALGGNRPLDDAAFSLAKAAGLLAQDNVWRPTERGLGALIAAGLIAGVPEPERRAVRVLWALIPDNPHVQFVGAWPDSFAEAFPTAYGIRLEEAQADFAALCEPDLQRLEFFWTAEWVPVPTRNVAELLAAEQRDGAGW